MRIILLGLPGSGKEELARSLAGHYDIPVLTLENTLKEIAAEKTELGRLVKEAAFAGKFSDELIMAALRIRLARPDAANGYVMEDFPRTTGQAETLEILIKALRSPINAVIKVAIESDDLMEHLVGQITCQNCGEKYNIYNNPPIVEGMCNVCGEKIRRRPDDYEENIANRLRNCEMIMAPLEQYFTEKGMLHKVAGNTTAKKILKKAVKLLDGLPPVEIPEDDNAPALPMDESLLKALSPPRSTSDDQPRRRGRPPRKKPVEPVVDSKAVKPATPIVDEKVAAAASSVIAVGEAKRAKARKQADKTKAAGGSSKSSAESKEAKKKATKKSAVKKSEVKKKVAQKAPAQKTPDKKTAGKKTSAKKPVTKKKTTATKKKVAKKATVKKKAVVKKKTVVKKKAEAAKKKVVKKAVAKKKVVKKSPVKNKVTKKTPAKKVANKKTVTKKKVVAKKKTPLKKVSKKPVVKKAVSKKVSKKSPVQKKATKKKLVTKKKPAKKKVAKKKVSRRR